VRVLLSTTSGAGHFRPLLPLARALTAAGHQVACAAPAEAADMVRREGLEHFPFDGVPPEHPDRLAAFARVPSLPHGEAEHLIGSEIFGRLNTTFALPGARAAVKAFEPDLVVHESGELAARLAAEVAGLPTVAVTPSLTISAYPRSMASGISGLRESLGLDADPTGDDLLRSPVVSWFPASFDLAEATAYDVHRYRHPTVVDRSPDTDRDLVYVTLGSEAASLRFFADVITQLAAGARGAELPVLVTTGQAADPQLFAGWDGVRVETWVDQDEVLRRARVVVCHAGSGTTLGALAAGVPIVAVPLFADQPYNAAQIEQTDVGRRVNPGPNLSAEVAAATAALAESAPRGCAEVTAEMAALPAVEEAVGWLESLTS
jgi:UDP:flavonoid glycosyltransferase YjiC (YdhE family)